MQVSNADKKQLNTEVANELYAELTKYDFVDMFYRIISDCEGSLEDARASLNDTYYMNEILEDATIGVVEIISGIFEKWLEKAEVTVTIKL